MTWPAPKLNGIRAGFSEPCPKGVAQGVDNELLRQLCQLTRAYMLMIQRGNLNVEVLAPTWEPVR